jgi:hypothetical protein
VIVQQVGAGGRWELVLQPVVDSVAEPGFPGLIVEFSILGVVPEYPLIESRCRCLAQLGKHIKDAKPRRTGLNCAGCRVTVGDYRNEVPGP